MAILPIDPGSAQSAWLVWDDKPLRFAIEGNEDLLERLRDGNVIPAKHLAIETLHPRGMLTAQQEFDTQLWAGRFIEAWGGPFDTINRLHVKMHHCGSARANDANISRALRDRFGEKGTKKAAKETKKEKTAEGEDKKQPKPQAGKKDKS